MARKKQSLRSVNLVAFGLSAVGLLLLWQDTQLFTGLGLVLAGAVVYDGLPTKRQLDAVLKTSPVAALLGLGVGLFYFRYFGVSSALESIMGAIFAVFIVQQFIIKGYQKLVKE